MKTKNILQFCTSEAADVLSETKNRMDEALQKSSPAVIIALVVAQKEVSEFNKSQNLLIEQARTMHFLLTGTVGEPGDLALFTAEFPTINAAFATNFLAAIDDADQTPGDNSVLSTQHLLTLSVTELVELSRRRLRRLFVYTRNAFEDNKNLKAILVDLGERAFVKAKSSQLKIKEALELSYSKANSTTYKTELIAAGFIQDRINDLNTLSISLTQKNTEQEGKKSGRPKVTQERIKKLNAVWNIMKRINNASKTVFETDFEKKKQYLLYPEHGSDRPTFDLKDNLAGGEERPVPHGSEEIEITAETEFILSTSKRSGHIDIAIWVKNEDGLPASPPPGSPRVNATTHRKTGKIRFSSLPNHDVPNGTLVAKNFGTDAGNYRIRGN